jgi:hypothetical protein
MNQTISAIIRFTIENFPILMTAFSFLLGSIAVIFKKNKPWAEIYLPFFMFFAVGLSGLWGFVMHAFFPNIASNYIGWAPSPFEYEVAIANLAMGIAGIFGAFADKSYRIATTIFTTIFLIGAAVGHVMQMLKTGNFAPGNAGIIFYNDIILPILLIIFVIFSKPKSTRDF